MTGTTYPLGVSIVVLITISGRNINNRTGMDPQGPIVTMIPESNRAKNCNIFDLVRKTPYFAYRGLLWYGTMKSEIENLVENLGDNKFYKNAERKNKLGV